MTIHAGKRKKRNGHLLRRWRSRLLHDDVLLFASTKDQLQKILCYFKHQKRNRDWQHQSEKLSKEESTKYLGQIVTFQQQDMTEIKNRIRAAWANFYKYNKSWPRNRAFFDIGFAYSTWWSPQRWTTPQEHGHSQKNTKQWFNRRSAKCPPHHTNGKSIQEKDTG